MPTPLPVEIQPIGIIRTPYREDGFCPHQPVEREEGEARIEIFEEFRSGLARLETFNTIYALYLLHRTRPEDITLEVSPAWARGAKAGLFATRTPHRPSPLGLSVLRLKRIENGVLFTNLVDVYDGTPLLDLKPYIRDLDSRPDANLGWIEELEGHDHLLDHVRGIPHGHGH